MRQVTPQEWDWEDGYETDQILFPTLCVTGAKNKTFKPTTATLVHDGKTVDLLRSRIDLHSLSQ
jgi:hypothetical protein